MNVLEQIDRGEYSLVRVYKREHGLMTSAEAPDVQLKLLRLAKLGASAEKIVCKCGIGDHCKEPDKNGHDCLMLNFCKLRK